MRRIEAARGLARRILDGYRRGGQYWVIAGALVPFLILAVLVAMCPECARTNQQQFFSATGVGTSLRIEREQKILPRILEELELEAEALRQRLEQAE